MTMPRQFPHFEMDDANYERIEIACKANSLGGLCVAISLKWLERVYRNEPLPQSFAQENLDELIQQQKAYAQLAGQANGDAGFIEYSRTRGFTAARIKGSRIYDSGEMDDLGEVVLEPQKGYMLSFSETDIGAQSAHVIALYQSGSGIEIRDQNIGQMMVADATHLNEQYEKVMAGHWQEVNAQREQVKKSQRSHIDLPQYRRWTLYSLTMP